MHSPPTRAQALDAMFKAKADGKQTLYDAAVLDLTNILQKGIDQDPDCVERFRWKCDISFFTLKDLEKWRDQLLTRDDAPKATLEEIMTAGRKSVRTHTQTLLARAQTHVVH